MSYYSTLLAAAVGVASFFCSAIFFQKTEAIILSIVVVLFYNYLTSGKSKENLPGGPTGLPILGVLPLFLYYKPYVYISNLGRKYGPMMNFYVGERMWIFVNDYEVSKQLSQNAELQGRPDDGILHNVTSGLGLITTEGPLWRHQRRFMVHSLRDSGMGKLHMQDKILDELSNVAKEINKYEGQPISMHSILEKSTSNLICALAFNKQYDYNDPYFLNLIHILDENFRLLERIQLLEAYWWTRLFIKRMVKTVHANFDKFCSVAKHFIEEHRETLDPLNPRDLIDLYIIEMSKKSTDNEDDEYLKTFFEDQLIQLISDLFAAGTETSSTTVRWAILYMIHHPEIQRKVQNEISEVIGMERMPTMEDRQSLPFTTATLQEVERLACVGPASLPRSNPHKFEFNGYTFPRRSIFFYNIYAIHRDPKLWDDPHEFKPSRFIDVNGKVFRPPQLIPFGSGRRACPGESLARMEIFLYFTTLMQKYVFKASSKDHLPDLESSYGFVRGPFPYKVQAYERN